MGLGLTLIVLLIALAGVVLAARLFLDGAVDLSHRLGLPEAVISAVVIAIGTSAPELAIGLSASLRGEGDIVIGNVVGSNIVNLGIAVGLAGMIGAFPAFDKPYRVTAWIGIGATALLLANTVAGLPSPEMSRMLALVLFAGLIAFLAASMRYARNSPGEKSSDHQNGNIGMVLLKLVGGSAGMAFAADVTVANATTLATELQIPPAIIGATVVAIGGSLPEIVSSIVAARAGYPGVAVGNVVGSQTFNLLGILGISALVRPFAYSASFAIDTIVLLGMSLLFMTAFYSAGMRRIIGPAMLISYLGYAGYLISVASS